MPKIELVPASRYPIGSEVSFGSFRGTVVKRWTYSLLLRQADGSLIYGGTECVVPTQFALDLEKLADEALL